MCKKNLMGALLGLSLLVACDSSFSQKTASVSVSVCNDSDQPIAEVYLNGTYAGGGNDAHARSGSVCCSRIVEGQPVTVEWKMDTYTKNPKPTPSYKASVPIIGQLRTDRDNYLAIHVDDRGGAKVVAETEERFFGPKGICKKTDVGVKHD